jgi:predicted DsbA family dithiol-disulfide isomerase
MTDLPTIELYSDIHCPWAYMALYRLRRVWPDYRGRVRVQFRSLSLELKNHRPTPLPVLRVEVPLMQQQEPELPIRQWTAPEWRFVPTLLPAFEASHAAAEQGDDAVWELQWQLRHAFFHENRTICMRFVLEDLAQKAGLDVKCFLADWDSGRFRRAVEADSHHGWEELQVPGSPTFVLPSGEQIPNPGAIKVEWGPNHEIVDTQPADCPNGDCLQPFRDLLDRAIESSR